MIDIKLYGEQYSVLQDWLESDKNCMNVIPVGSGKTFLASIALPIMATNEKYHKGKDIVYSAPTTAMIKALIWESLKNACINHFGLIDGKDINNSELTIKFKNGIFIRCKSAEQRENLRGLNVGTWIADEAALYTADTLQEITNRLRPKVGQPDTAGRLIIISTPHGNGPLKELFDTALKLPNNWIVRHYNYEQMRSGNLKFILQQKQILSPLKFAQDYLCSWESVEDQFFYAWNAKYINDTTDRRGDLYCFMDFNKRVMNAVIAQVIKPGKLDGKLEVLTSYSIPNCGTEQMAQAIRADYNHRNIFAVIDMSGTQVNRDTTSPFGVTDRTILEKYGFTIVNSKRSNPLIADTDNSSNAFIARGGLSVPSHCVKLLEALSSFHYEDASRKKLVKSMEQAFAHIDGLGDALRYGIHHLFPIQHDIPNMPDYMSDRPTRQAGSEYVKPSPLYPGGPTLEDLLNNEETHNSDYMEY
jgi:hypothetical protein